MHTLKCSCSVAVAGVRESRRRVASTHWRLIGLHWILARRAVGWHFVSKRSSGSASACFESPGGFIRASIRRHIISLSLCCFAMAPRGSRALVPHQWHGGPSPSARSARAAVAILPGRALSVPELITFITPARALSPKFRACFRVAKQPLCVCAQKVQ